MVLCIIALVVFSLLGIFSARYRALAAEAFDCVFRKITLRPCTTNLDQRIRARTVAKIFVRSPKVAGFVKRYFEPLSWMFVILTIASGVLAAQAGHNLWKYGTCTPSAPGQCVFIQDHEGADSGKCTPQPTAQPEFGPARPGPVMIR